MAMSHKDEAQERVGEMGMLAIWIWKLQRERGAWKACRWLSTTQQNIQIVPCSSKMQGSSQLQPFHEACRRAVDFMA